MKLEKKKEMCFRRYQKSMAEFYLLAIFKKKLQHRCTKAASNDGFTIEDTINALQMFVEKRQFLIYCFEWHSLFFCKILR